MTATTLSQGFELETSSAVPAVTRPQQVGTRLWKPMLAMALMAFPLALLIGIARSGAVAGGSEPTTIAALGHIGAGFMFLGFAAVFAAISFAIARILGVFRVGGGQVQAAAGRSIKTLKMPLSAKVFIGLMVMAMMAIVMPVMAHLLIGLALLGGNATAAAESESWFLLLEGIRRLGVSAYLVAIAFGLASIIEVLRFQAARIRELPEEAPLSAD